MASIVDEIEGTANTIKSWVVGLAAGGLAVLTGLLTLFPVPDQPQVVPFMAPFVVIAFTGAVAAVATGRREWGTRLCLGAASVGTATYHVVEHDGSITPFVLMVMVLGAVLLRGREAAALAAALVAVGVGGNAWRAIGQPINLWVPALGGTMAMVIVAAGSTFGALLAERLQAALRVRLAEIEVVLDRARRVAVGDLSWEVEGDGDVADTLRGMNQGLRHLVAQIQRGSHSLGAASSQLAAMAAEQERSALELAGGFEEIQRTLSGFNESSSQIADHTRKVADVANQTVQTNHLIDEQLRGLASHTERIKDILSTINGIANKSDLLALNASLEAVRAGESGRGFALVASQMQKLSESVVASVDDIRALTSDIRSASAASLGSSTLAAQLAETTSARAEEISLITQQQRSATSAVVEAVKDISEYTRQSSEASAEGSASVRDLQVLAGDLRGLVARFTLNPATA